MDAFDARDVRSLGCVPISAPPRVYSSCRMISACSSGDDEAWRLDAGWLAMQVSIEPGDTTRQHCRDHAQDRLKQLHV
jgi:hypothetical protein